MLPMLYCIFQEARKHAEQFKKVPKLLEDDDMLDDEVRLMKKKNMKENRITSSSSQGIEKPGDPKMSKRKLKKMNR